MTDPRVNTTRITSRAGAAAVAGIAAVVSYVHMRDLAASHGQADALAALWPLSVDGLLVVAAVAMADDRAAGRTPRWSARLSFIVGVSVSIVANTLAAPDDLLARAISAWPALALLLVVEMLPRRGKPLTTATQTGHVVLQHDRPLGPDLPPQQSASPPTAAVVVDDADGAEESAAQRVRQDERPAHLIETVVRALKANDPDLSQRKIAEMVMVPEVRVRRILKRTVGPEPAQRLNGHVPDLEGVN